MAIRLDDVDLQRDRTLVERFQGGDCAAFDELYGRYRHRLERFCLKRTGDHHAAEEIAQEAFTRALAALPALGGERRFYPWVSVIASRLCVDHHRTQARAETVSHMESGAVAGGEDAIVDAVDAALVTTAMGRLGPRHQDVLRLREVEGWSYRKIADHYGVPIGTIETLLFRARRALRREFDLIDGAGLVAVPFVGWLVRGLARARDRVAPMASLSSAQSSLAAAAAATVTAVAVAVGPGGPSPAARDTRQVAAGPLATGADSGAGSAVGAPAQPGPAAAPAAPPVGQPTSNPVTGVLESTTTIAPAKSVAAAAARPPPATVLPLPVPSIVVIPSPVIDPSIVPIIPPVLPGVGLPIHVPPVQIPEVDPLAAPNDALAGQLDTGVRTPRLPAVVDPLLGKLGL